MKAWDLGGQAACRDEWGRYARGCDVILFIVDVADVSNGKEIRILKGSGIRYLHKLTYPSQTKNINQARYELHRLLDKPELHKVPLLVIGNKVDVEPHLPVEDLVKGILVYSYGRTHSVRLCIYRSGLTYWHVALQGLTWIILRRIHGKWLASLRHKGRISKQFCRG